MYLYEYRIFASTMRTFAKWYSIESSVFVKLSLNHLSVNHDEWVNGFRTLGFSNEKKKKNKSSREKQTQRRDRSIGRFAFIHSEEDLLKLKSTRQWKFQSEWKQKGMTNANAINCFPVAQKHWTTANSCSCVQWARGSQCNAASVFSRETGKAVAAAAAAHTPSPLTKTPIRMQQCNSKSISQSMWSHLCWQDSLFHGFSVSWLSLFSCFPLCLFLVLHPQPWIHQLCTLICCSRIFHVSLFSSSAAPSLSRSW